MIREFLAGAAIVLGIGTIPGVWLGAVFADEITAIWRKVFPPDTGEHVARARLRRAEDQLSAAVRAGHHVPAREIERAFAGSRPSGLEPLAVSGGTPEDAPARPGQGTSGVITTPLLAAPRTAIPAECSACGYDVGPCTCPDDCGGLVCTGSRHAPVPVPAWLPVERVRAEGDPFTGAQPALTPETEAELRRVWWIRSQMEAAEEVTPELMREVLAGLRALPVYGEAPQLEVREAERLAGAMLQ